MKTLNTNNIEKIEEKPKRSKIKEFLAVSVMVAGLLVTSCGDKQTKPEINDNDKEKPDITNVIDEESILDEDNILNENDKEKPEITDIVDEEYIPDEDVDLEINDTDNESDLEPEIAEEFKKPCYNPFEVAEIFAKRCVEYMKYTVNGEECGTLNNAYEWTYIQTLECGTRDGVEQLKRAILNNGSDHVKSAAGGIINSIKLLYIKEKFADGVYKLIDKADPIITNNDTVEGYNTEFTFGGKKFFVKDDIRGGKPSTDFEIYDEENKIYTNLYPGAVINDYDQNYQMLVMRWEYGYCTYPKENSKDTTIVINTFVLANAQKAYDAINLNNQVNNCDAAIEQYLEEYKEKIEKEN